MQLQLSELLHFDDFADSASASTEQSQTDSTWTDESVGCDSASYVSNSSQSFLTTVILEQRGKRNEVTNNSRFIDEEEGSYISTVDASTVSIRSRFISSGNRNDTGTKGTGAMPKKIIGAQENCKVIGTTSRERKCHPIDTNASERNDQPSYKKQDVVNEHKGIAPQRIPTKDKRIDSKQYCDAASTTQSFAGSKTSMDEIDLNSLIMR